ncbi:DapH/DapD/GlmU-related protein [uncultured Fusobacterium sp.]|uniref:DapH/DapD/GlmU-related protein n=1 Tax=uncultured Fusobacterium sp. TaxID=159267 RepID=UPI0026013B49|nr:DapH/DapD/GlmU-related protein [uncultured Fusobacterium sp.]
MKLSELNIGEVIRDSEFDWLGLTAEEYEGRKVLTFLNDEKYIKEIIENKTVTSVITTEGIGKKLNKKYGIIVCINPKKIFFELHNFLVEKNFYKKSFKSKISKNSRIAKNVIIPENNVIIEDNVVIESGTTIKEHVILKKNSIIRSNCVIGDQAFEFYKDENEILGIKCIGNVILDENTEIQSGTIIERGVFSSTYVGKNVKIDNLIHIGHDVKIGNNTFIIAGTVVGGRTRIGKNCYLSINSSIRNGLKIGNDVTVNMGAVVTKDVNDNETVTGNFAIPHDKFLKFLKYIFKILGE